MRVFFSVLLFLFLPALLRGNEPSGDGYFDARKKRGKFSVVKMEEFEKFCVLHLKRKDKFYKTVAPKLEGKNCFRAEVGKLYYFLLSPMLALPRRFVMHGFFMQTDYYDETITMERNPAYARNVYEIKNIKGICP